MSDSSAARLARCGMIDMESNTTLVQQYPAHEAVPENAHPLPSVIVLHDIFGLTPFVRSFSTRLAREGFYVLAPNLYAHPFSVAAGARPDMGAVSGIFGASEHEAAEERAGAIGSPRLLEIIRAAASYCAISSAADSSRIAVVGFGFGGRAAFLAACAPAQGLRAAVAYSPTSLACRDRFRMVETMPILEAENLAVPILIFYGDQDIRVRSDELAAVERVLTAEQRPHRIVTLREAPHGFFDEESADHRIGAARQAWEEMLVFLGKTIQGRV
jgi:carboxymethylenebutenolidase